MEKAKASNPYFQNVALDEMVDDADRYHALKVLSDTEGGQILVDTHIKVVVSAINRLERYHTMERDELVSICAEMAAALNTARSLSRAAENLSYVDDALEEALRE